MLMRHIFGEAKLHYLGKIKYHWLKISKFYCLLKQFNSNFTLLQPSFTENFNLYTYKKKFNIIASVEISLICLAMYFNQIITKILGWELVF